MVTKSHFILEEELVNPRLRDFRRLSSQREDRGPFVRLFVRSFALQPVFSRLTDRRPSRRPSASVRPSFPARARAHPLLPLPRPGETRMFQVVRCAALRPRAARRQQVGGAGCSAEPKFVRRAGIVAGG